MQYRLKCTALVPRTYRLGTGRDFFTDMKSFTDSYLKVVKKEQEEFKPEELTILENLLWAMIDDPNKPGTPDEWLDTIEGMFNAVDYATLIIKAWAESIKTTSKAEKKT